MAVGVKDLRSWFASESDPIRSWPETLVYRRTAFVDNTFKLSFVLFGFDTPSSFDGRCQTWRSWWPLATSGNRSLIHRIHSAGCRWKDVERRLSLMCFSRRSRLCFIRAPPSSDSGPCLNSDDRRTMFLDTREYPRSPSGARATRELYLTRSNLNELS